MSEPFLGMISIFGFNFAPRGWAMCNGQILAIAQNTALFSLLGTTYGGNGQTTFALPNLQSRVPIHFGQGPGLSAYALGQAAGSESVTLTNAQMPQHNHGGALLATNATADDSIPAGAYLAQRADGTANFKSSPPAPATAAMAQGTIPLDGGSQPVSILEPYLALNFCIALEGIFPSRN